jgi:hypothetical protein
MRKPIVLFFLTVPFLVACATTSVTKTGTLDYPQLEPNEEVSVFTAEDQIKSPFDVVGTVSYNNPGKHRNLTPKAAIKPLKAKARLVGGNAIIIDTSRPVKSGIVSTGIHVEARAIRLRRLITYFPSVAAAH